MSILAVIFFVLIIYAALAPIVDWLCIKKIPRILAVMVVYIAMLALGALIGIIIIPPFITQIQQLINNMPDIIARIYPSFTALKNFYQDQVTIVEILQKPLTSFSEQMTQIPSYIFSTASGFFIFVGVVLSVFVITFYLLLEKSALKNILEYFLQENQKEKIYNLLSEVKIKWGSWVRGQLLLVLIIGFIDFIGLSIINVPYALSLAVLVGVMEIIPYFGPVIAAIPAVIIAYFAAPWKALAVLILYILVQQIESYVIVPKVMQKAVGLSPVIIIIALMIGAKLFGFLGILLAVPTAVGIIVLITEWKKLTT